VERQDEWLNFRADELLNDCVPEEILTGGPPRCPLCGAPVYGLRFIRRLSDTVTLAWQCPVCGVGGLISVPVVSPIASDLTPSEQIAFAGLPPIDEANVQRIRHLLQTHQGDLRDLF